MNSRWNLLDGFTMKYLIKLLVEPLKKTLEEFPVEFLAEILELLLEKIPVTPLEESLKSCWGQGREISQNFMEKNIITFFNVHDFLCKFPSLSIPYL